MYDFNAADGQIRCDHATCETALRLQQNVGTYRTWVRLIAAEEAWQGKDNPGRWAAI